MCICNLYKSGACDGLNMLAKMSEITELTKYNDFQHTGAVKQ